MTGPAATTGEAPVSDGTMPCPVPHPDGVDAPCRKKIPKGWTAGEGHAGGHYWASDAAEAFLDTGHYDTRDALNFKPLKTHEPRDCGPHCPRYWGKPR